jgi:hypothetical protein
MSAWRLESRALPPDWGPRRLRVLGAFLTTFRLLFAENLLNERIALLTGQLRMGFFFVSHRAQPTGIIRLEQKVEITGQTA